MEMWKRIEELPEYLINGDGKIMKEATGDLVKTSVNNLGYVRVTITKNVHRLVAKAFLDAPESEDQVWVDHIDGNRSNCSVDNLRWVTPSENTLAFGYTSRMKSKRRAVKATHLDGKEIIFESRQAAADYFGCSDSEITYNHLYIKKL